MITGLPGSGKTLLAIEMLKDNADSENPRPVFTNIKGVDHKQLRTFEITNEAIPNIRGDNYPVGSVFVIDEAQEIFEPKPAGSKKTPIISLFETRRHYGYDFVIVTQHPMLIHKNVRLLISNHYHNVRPFGVDYRNVLQWSSVNEDPEPNHGQTDAVITKKRHDKELFSYYKSSSLHVKNKVVPKKPFIVLGAALLLLVSASVYAISSIYKGDIKVTPEQPSEKLSQTLEPNEDSSKSFWPAPTHEPNQDEEFPDGFVSSTLISIDGQLKTQIFFRYKNEIYELNYYDHSIDGRKITVYFDNLQFKFKLPNSVDLTTVIT
jgi:zona occludens toxin